MQNFDQKLKDIATLREQKGKEDETLDKIVDLEKEAELENNQEVPVKLNWEKSLVYQHVAMNEEALENPNQQIIKDAVSKMEEATLRADQLVSSFGLDKLKATSNRFLAQVYRYKKDYDKAFDAYKKAEAEYETAGDVGYLEVRGFIAMVLVLQGKAKEGLELAVKTFEDFDSAPLAITLKQKDYVTWAIWKAGIFPRVIKALMETKADFDKDLLADYLKKSEEILTNPQGPITWGDGAFKFRIDEIRSASAVLAALFVLVLTV